MKHYLFALAIALSTQAAQAQSQLYPQHFDLGEVRLLDGPFLNAMKVNDRLLLQYDADRLMTPFIRQAGLHERQGSRYYGWTDSHPSFSNWGLKEWSLEGHVGGHYLTALALAYAATDDAQTKRQMKERLDYCLAIVRDCQEAFAGDTCGMRGFVGGQPINQIWTGLYRRDLTEFRKYGYWVPFYCEHKILAGLRDAWIYTGSKAARDCFRQICDWAASVVSNLSDKEMQSVLDFEHGGMNETLADAYRLFGDGRYLDAAKRYSHAVMVRGMQGDGTYDRAFLNGRHANTQVPKYIGFQRIAQEDRAATEYRTAARNFWSDVADNRTVCIGGNSINEHFLSQTNCEKYISEPDGPESCNTNNMMKLSEMLFDDTHDARYADFYEYAMWNHILSTQDPETGGYVYFTSLRPQAYRIYSQVNQGMWCCVGTGMENHSKYGHFIYSHDGRKTLYVNLFTPSTLKARDFALTQRTEFPYGQSTTLTVQKAGQYTIAIRHPQWAADGYAIAVNGERQDIAVEKGKASYATLTRKWRKGDVIEVSLPMELRYEECPGYPDYVAFMCGPILLGAQTTATGRQDEAATGLRHERLKNEYGDESRMGHSPGVMGKMLPLSSAPLLLCDRADLLSRIRPTGAMRYAIQADAYSGQWGILTLRPFHEIHHARYMCYWYQRPRDAFMQSDMTRADREAKAIADRTIDFVATGEQQSEAGHDALYSPDSRSGAFRDELYRDAQRGGYIQYTLSCAQAQSDSLSLMLRYVTADRGRAATIYIDGEPLQSLSIPQKAANADDGGFFNMELPIPPAMLLQQDGKTPKPTIKVRLAATGDTPLPGCYYMRLLRK